MYFAILFALLFFVTWITTQLAATSLTIGYLSFAASHVRDTTYEVDTQKSTFTFRPLRGGDGIVNAVRVFGWEHRRFLNGREALRYVDYVVTVN